jgi:hypothetical protein
VAGINLLATVCEIVTEQIPEPEFPEKSSLSSSYIENNLSYFNDSSQNQTRFTSTNPM